MKKILFLAGLIWIGAAAILYAQSDQSPVSELLYHTIQSEGVEAAIAQYKALRKNESTQYDLSEEQLNALGYKLLNENSQTAALAIFKLNSETYPKSINVWDSLGEAYLEAGNYNQAARNYKRTLDMIEADTTLGTQQKNRLKFNASFNLYKVEHFNPPSDEALHYVSFFGGLRAGKWDMENVSRFASEQGVMTSHDGYNFYASPVPADIEKTLAGSKPGDVFTSFVAGDYRRFIEKGLIADLSSLWEQEGWDDVFPASFKRMATHNGKQYFIPMAYQWNPVWYRKDIFEKHHLTPPQSWQELLDLCDQLHELGYAPFSIAVQNWPAPVNRWFTTLNLRLNGPAFHKKVVRGEIPFTDKRIRNVFVHWRELFRHHAFADSSFQNNYQKGIQDLVSGKAVMYNLGEWIFESLNEQQGANLDFFAFPPMNPDVPSAEIVHTYGAFMRAGTSHPGQSVALLKWLASSESQQSNVEANSRVVANMNVDRSLYTKVQKRIITHINNTEVLVPLLEMDARPEFAREALKIFQAYWNNPEDIDAAMAKLEEARLKIFTES